MSEFDIVEEWLQISYNDYDSAKHLYDTKKVQILVHRQLTTLVYCLPLKKQT